MKLSIVSFNPLPQEFEALKSISKSRRNKFDQNLLSNIFFSLFIFYFTFFFTRYMCLKQLESKFRRTNQLL